MWMVACVLAPMGIPAPAAAPSGSGWESIRARGVLRVGTPGDYAPYALRDPEGVDYHGVDVSLAREIAADLGLGIRFVPTQWSSLVQDARAGNFDIAVGGVSITPERLREVQFTSPYLTDHKTPLTRCGEEARFDTQAEIDQPQVRLVVNPGGTNERFARAQFPAARLAVHMDNITVFEEIRSGRADVMVTDGVEARLQEKLTPGLCAAEAAPDWAESGKAILVAGDLAALQNIEAALERSLRRSAYSRRLEQWLGYDWRGALQGRPAQVLARLADERLNVVIDVARWKWNREAPIEDLQRETALLGAMHARAWQHGVTASRVDSWFQAQIAAAKFLQRDLFASWEQRHAGTFAGVADLDRELRPRIDRLNSAMLDALGDWDGAPSHADVLGPLGVGGLSEDAAAEAVRPLLAAGTPAPPDSP